MSIRNAMRRAYVEAEQGGRHPSSWDMPKRAYIRLMQECDGDDPAALVDVAGEAPRPFMGLAIRILAKADFDFCLNTYQTVTMTAAVSDARRVPPRSPAGDSGAGPRR